MGKDNCSNDQVKRDGSAQKNRYLNALDPENNPVDGRSIEDLLVFAKHYASLLRFYDLNENKNQDNTPPVVQNQKQNEKNDHHKPNKNYDSWKEFFYSDISVVLASIKVFGKKLAHVKKEYEDKRAQLEANPVKDNFRELFTTNVHHLQRINRWYQRSIPNHPLQYELGVKIKSSLAPALRKQIAYNIGAGVSLSDDLNIMALYDDFKSAPWEADYSHIKLDATIYVGADEKSRIKHAALYLDDIFQEIFRAYTQLYESSDAWLSNSLNNFPEHQPHMALFICFIELFQLAQTEINTLTQKHLDFYYRDVLQLKERAANPDSVYLIYELAKGFDTYPLEKGTALTAGKDLTGKELIYKTDSELVINKAIVKELKTIFLDKQLKATPNNPPIETDYEIKNIYAAPIANSANGLGEKFTVPETAWSGFGYFKPEKDAKNNDIINKIGEEAQIGFAIASPQLFLAEGERIITITISLDNLSTLKDKLLINLTGLKGWLNEVKTEHSISSTTPGINNETIKITIPVSADPIVKYDKNIHGENYKTVFPIIKFIFKNTTEFENFKNVVISGMTIDVDVSGVKNLMLSNDNGPIDQTKPFNPFTVIAKPNSGFVIGSKEIFSKKLSTLELNFNKMNSEGDAATFKVKPELFSDNQWKKVKSDDKALKYQGITFDNLGADKNLSDFERQNNLNDDIIISKSNYGFLRLNLQYVFHKKAKDYFAEEINESHSEPSLFQLFQYIAFLLEIKDLSINYSSEQQYVAGIEQFFHIYPFGEAETFPLKNIPTFISETFEELKTKQNDLLINTNLLLPQFKFGKEKEGVFQTIVDTELKKFPLNQYYTSVFQQGNLYIGIENLTPPQNLSLLFKIADGTADDNDSDPPLINWSYLVKNELRPLPDDRIISDSTYGLQTTGIVLIDFPEESTKNNTIITKDLHWLCISIDKYADRFPKIIDVIAQANSAKFFDLSNLDPLLQNDPEHYRKPLPEGTISKLVTKVAEVKKITQPFESFDNKMREEGKDFYPRVSERLRHKGRAITPWDYEHIVLENFRGVYKVKCITHTDPECVCRKYNDTSTTPATAKCCCNQVAPGHVLIVPVSNLRNKSKVNVLKPRIGRRTMIKIKQYLEKRVSAFVHVHVHNPLFEEVKVFFNVKFMSGVDKGSNLTRLNNDLIRHLTPWAFDASSELVFGGKVYASNIINFIEERNYVDYITCFKMIHIKDDCCEPKKFEDITCEEMKVMSGAEIDARNEIEIEPSSTYGILVSAEKHCIILIEEEPDVDPCNSKL